mmetsp:Transcript_12700/g.28011  ORF Transcript_12700/g.28011 Transcript_12700/m.28011 type:complete len:211 (+) Transcript_12700:201-833(+)
MLQAQYCTVFFQGPPLGGYRKYLGPALTVNAELYQSWCSHHHLTQHPRLPLLPRLPRLHLPHSRPQSHLQHLFRLRRLPHLHIPLLRPLRLPYQLRLSWLQPCPCRAKALRLLALKISRHDLHRTRGMQPGVDLSLQNPLHPRQGIDTKPMTPFCSRLHPHHGQSLQRLLQVHAVFQHQPRFFPGGLLQTFQMRETLQALHTPGLHLQAQ